MVELQIESEVKDLRAGVVEAQGLQIGPAQAELRTACADLVARVLRDGMEGGEPRREAVRQMLREGGFKPAGRSKPAQECLLRTLKDTAELPSIFNAVDWLNAISLASGLPISLLSASRLGPRLGIRYGRAGERFVFNRAGQELDVAGLICVCAGFEHAAPALGTPIKDSLAGKIVPEDRDVVAVIYAPQSAVTSDVLNHWCRQFADGLSRYCEASRTAYRLSP